MSDYNFQGISLKAIDLLCENRFKDSREFYEEHKQELKDGIIIPMRKIMLDLSGLMYSIDEKMMTDPVKSVSRIYRDTRGRRDKIKYRENMWMFFRRYKNDYPCAPFYFFEFFPDCYRYGLAFWVYQKSLIKTVHRKIIDEPERWILAVKACEKAGLKFECDEVYKKTLYPDAPAKLQSYLKAKNMLFVHSSSDLTEIASPHLIDELKNSFKKAKPMYEFFAECYDSLYNEGYIKPNE